MCKSGLLHKDYVNQINALVQVGIMIIYCIGSKNCIGTKCKKHTKKQAAKINETSHIGSGTGKMTKPKFSYFL